MQRMLTRQGQEEPESWQSKSLCISCVNEWYKIVHILADYQRFSRFPQLEQIIKMFLYSYSVLIVSSYFVDSGSPKASRPAWPKSGSTSVGCPSDPGPASWTSASFRNRATLGRCVRGWWKMWKYTTATTPSSSWVSSSIACKANNDDRVY